jgi:hypothetical protein
MHPILLSRFRRRCNEAAPAVPAVLPLPQMARRAFVVDWNGKDLPSELRELPAGRYVIEANDDVESATFSDDEERGIELALAQYRRGETVDLAQARKLFDSLLRK